MRIPCDERLPQSLQPQQLNGQACYSELRDTESLRPNVNPVAGYMLKVSASGFSLDATIQTGVDNPGHPFILIVGAASSQGFRPTKLLANFFILSSKSAIMASRRLICTKRVSTRPRYRRYVVETLFAGRSIRGFSLPPRCSRAVRREVESIVSWTLKGLKGELFFFFFSFFVWLVDCSFFLSVLTVVTTCWNKKENCVNTFEYFI